MTVTRRTKVFAVGTSQYGKNGTSKYYLSKTKKVKAEEVGRKCLSCTTLLSVYNHTDFCNTHREHKRPIVRGGNKKSPKKMNDCTSYCISCIAKKKHEGQRKIWALGTWHIESQEGKISLCGVGLIKT